MSDVKRLSANRMLIYFVVAIILLFVVTMFGTRKSAVKNELNEITPVSVEKLNSDTSVVRLSIDHVSAKQNMIAFFTSHQYVEFY